MIWDPVRVSLQSTLIELEALSYEPPPAMLQTGNDFIRAGYAAVLLQKAREAYTGGYEFSYAERQEQRTLPDFLWNEAGQVTDPKTPTTWLPLDFSGWKYFSQGLVNTAQRRVSRAIKETRGHTDDSLVVSLQPQIAAGTGGGFIPSAFQITVHYRIGEFTRDAFEEMVKNLQIFYYHELQHAAQYFLKIVRRMEDLGGLPSKDIRNPDIDYVEMALGPDTDEYFLTDIEFYPIIESSVAEMSQLLKSRVPHELWKDNIREFLMKTPPFSVFREKNQGKWRKAVNIAIQLFDKYLEGVPDLHGVLDPTEPRPVPGGSA